MMHCSVQPPVTQMSPYCVHTKHPLGQALAVAVTPPTSIATSAKVLFWMTRILTS